MDTAPMFEKGTSIVYVNGDRYEIGRVVSTHPDGAFVCYHEGETAAKTPYDCMHRLENQYVMTSLGGDRFANMPKGEWIDDGDTLICNKCHTAYTHPIFHNGWNYCPNCGAKMGVKNE